jgi:UDP-4-amino-4,6-dideoxy-N-acetyl-beta-L-altrosamine N-acetyltransferase
LLETDLIQVLNWRNSEPIRMNMYTDRLISWEEHLEWYLRTKDSLSSRHMIFEYQEASLGVVNITQIDSVNHKCYWGFYLGEPNVAKGCGSAMGYLGLEYIFKELGIRKLCSEAFCFNQASIKFHKKLGFVEEGLLKQHIIKNHKYQDIVCLALFQDVWFEIANNILESLKMITEEDK